MYRLIEIDGYLVPHILGGADSTNAQIGSLSSLFYWNATASPAAYQTLGKVRSIQGVGVNKTEVDSTTLDSTGVDRIGGLPDGKQITIVLTLTAASLLLVEGFLNSTASIDLKLTTPAPSSTSRYFSMLPLDYDRGTMTASGLLEITLQGRMTGAAPSGSGTHGV